MFDIQKFMARNNWSQYDLADRLGVTRSKVSGWCAGYRYPDFENVCILIRHGMTINELFGDELEAIILKGQPSLDIAQLSPEDCRKIVALGLSGVQEQLKGPSK